MCYLYLNKAENFLNTKEKKEEGKRDLSGKIKMLYILIQVKVTRMYVFVKSVPGFPGGSDGKESVCNSGDLGWKDSLEEGMATPSSILAWRIPQTEEPGKLQSLGLQRVKRDWVTKHSTAHILKIWDFILYKLCLDKIEFIKNCLSQRVEHQMKQSTSKALQT